MTNVAPALSGARPRDWTRQSAKALLHNRLHLNSGMARTGAISCVGTAAPAVQRRKPWAKLENPAKVFVHQRGLAHLLPHTVSELFENIAVHIADVRDAGSASVRLERREMSIGAPIKTDNSKVEAIIGAEDLAITLCRSFHGQPRRAHCQCIEKLTSRNHHSPQRARPCPLCRKLTRFTCDQQEGPAFIGVVRNPFMLTC